ncbi:MAG: glycine cleavage system aminomethyltransferase GcvT [Hyphomicrobiales bacterium]|nr:glycine cleavage system aminomethyltransferase GcvT [Hyphomicrobiales bacterium]
MTGIDDLSVTSNQDLGPLQQTPLHAAHVAANGKLVAFAGYEMPVQYPTGVLAEHLHTRSSAGAFDVSHMGQAFIDGHPDPADVLEQLVPGDIKGLAPGHSRYTMLLNELGGVVDDLIVSRLPRVPGRLFVVVNASRKANDFALMRSRFGGRAALTELNDRVLIALQGPKAATVLSRMIPDAVQLSFMQCALYRIGRFDAIVTRSGYTGEDGFEISMPQAAGVPFWQRLLGEAEVKPIGLGARDSLRLEAGLCLYGHDVDETTSPIEAGLSWTIGKRRRASGDFPGAERILEELVQGPARKRVGLRPDGRAPAREGTIIVDETGKTIGSVTSGGFAPSLDAPIAMGYVEAAYAEIGTKLGLVIRGKVNPARVVAMPFIPHQYKRSH